MLTVEVEGLLINIMFSSSTVLVQHHLPKTLEPSIILGATQIASALQIYHALHESVNLLSLPVELLIQIFAHLPSSSFQSLINTCTTLRHVFSVNAATICNTNIRENYPLILSILDVQPRNGWLTPTHPMFLKYETITGAKLCKQPNYPAQTFKLSEPGPLFLKFLERSYEGILETHNVCLAYVHVNPTLFGAAVWTRHAENWLLMLNQAADAHLAGKRAEREFLGQLMWYYGQSGVVQSFGMRNKCVM